MAYKTLISSIVVLMLCISLYSAVELYDYDESEELLAEYDELFWENKLSLTKAKKLNIIYYNDFNKNYNNRLYLLSQAEKLNSYFNLKEKESGRIFIDYHTSNWQFGFGNFKPTFGLGNSYSPTHKHRFIPKVTSHSPRDLQGAFGSYQNDYLQLNLFHSSTQINYRTNKEGANYLTYSADNQSKYIQSGLIITYILNSLELNFMSVLLDNEVEITQFHNKKSLFLLTTNIGYETDNLVLDYELTSHHDEYDHAAKIAFSQGDFSTTWNYKNLSKHSLNWINSGISNRYNSDAVIYSGENKLHLFNTDIQLGSTLKTPKDSNFWRTNVYCKLNIRQRLEYRISQDRFRDSYDANKRRYSHRIKANLFNYDSSSLNFTYSLHNKTYQTGVANMYQLDFKYKLSWATLKLNLKVLDNYKDEELVQDSESAVIATFYEFKEDAIISGEIKTKELHHFTLRSVLTKSLYHRRTDSLKLEVSYLL